ncbi:hypothetical protein U1Q18_026369 [Sarracenia purpurea var. burkii]
MKLQSFPVVTSILVILSIIIPLIIGDLNSDRQALLEFASSVPHSRKINWNSSLSVCSSWVGISCNDDQTRVSEIHLPGVGLYGPIPTNSIGKLDALRVLSLRSNYLNGSLPSDILSIPSLQSLYLQHNNFSGEIPSVSSQLIVLDLSFNSFSGDISPIITNFLQLTVLSLQFNSFSGSIPDINLPRLKLLNMSYNMLNGSVPHSLQKFPISSFTGNPLLCGPPLNNCSAGSSPSPSPIYLPSPSYNKKLGTGSIVAIALGGSSILCFLVLVILIFWLKKKNSDGSGLLKGKKAVNGGGRSEKPEDFGSGVQEAEKNKLVFFDGCSYNFDLEDLLRASAEVLGKGSFGTAYKAVLDEGTMVMVKRLREVVVGKREFEQQMEVVGRVGKQHPNVVPLRAYYYSKDEKLLVCDHYPMGSLCALLHGMYVCFRDFFFFWVNS